MPADQMEQAFSVGDVVNVLSAFRLPKVEEVIHTGRIDNVTTPPSGTVYWIEGLAVGRGSNVLRKADAR